MIVLNDLQPPPSQCRGGVLSIGNFDGVHRGHVQLVHRLRAAADARQTRAIAITFDPHPVQLLRPEAAPVPLVWLDRKVELLRSCGVDEVVVFHTSWELLRLTAQEFFDRIIVDQFAAGGLVEGSNFGFGRDRQGNLDTLVQFCGRRGMLLEIAESVDFRGAPISSSRIRRLLGAGEVEVAAELLGRPYALRGQVARGAGRGAAIGMPTANLEKIDTLVPRPGVYAVRARATGRLWRGALNIGPNPTFGESATKVEVHLLDFSGSLQGAWIELEFVVRLRDTTRFDGVDALLHQVGQDLDRVRELIPLS